MKLVFLCIFISMVLLSRGNAELPRKSLSLCDLGNLKGWEGLAPDPTVTYRGMHAPKWEHSKFPTARTDRIPHDWSQFNCLGFALHSEKATQSSFMLILGSETPGTEGSDYFSLRITIDWVGWKEFIVPFNELSQSRQLTRVARPAGFQKIDSIAFTAEGWSNQPNPESALRIADPKLSCVEGPAISDAELFGILDLERPGLGKVKAAVRAGKPIPAEIHEIEDLSGTKAKHNF